MMAPGVRPAAKPRPHTQTAVRSAAYCALTVRPWESALLVLLVPVPGCLWTEMTSLAMMLKPEVASHEPVCLAPKVCPKPTGLHAESSPAEWEELHSDSLAVGLPA